MKILYRLLSVAAAALLLLRPIHTGAVFAPPELISGKFTYLSSDGSGSYTGTYFYSDDYFSRSGKEKNLHLRTMSLDLALTAFGSSEPVNSQYTMSLLEDIGFPADDIRTYDMEIQPSADTLGTVIAHRKTRYGEVLACAVRGGYYGSEWKNTLDIGKSGDAAGFSAAADKLASRIRNYEKEFGISGAKIWITGYSRGGTAADLCGRYINEHTDEFGVTGDDIYVYTFEAPAGSGTRTGYENIHNVYDTCDIVPMLYPASWGLGCSGVAEELTGAEIKLRRQQLDISLSGISVSEKHTTKFNTRTFMFDDIYDPPVSMHEIETEFVSWLSSVCSRADYAAHSESIGELVDLFMSRSGTSTMQLFTYLKNICMDVVYENIPTVYYVVTGDGSGYLEKLISALNKALDASDHSSVMTDSEYRTFKRVFPDVLRFAVPIAKRDVSGTQYLVNILSFLGNTDAILPRHSQENIIVLAEAEDNYYSPEDITQANITVDETNARVTSVTFCGRKLIEGFDYTVFYKDEAGMNVSPQKSGVYTALIKGKGSYTGIAEKEFTAVFPHRHKWAITSEGEKVRVQCTADECDYGTGKPYFAEIVCVKSKVYDGEPVSASVVTSAGFPKEIQVSAPAYHLPGVSGARRSGKKLDEAPSLPGIYIVSVIVSERDNDENAASAETEMRIDRIVLDEAFTSVEFEENSADIASVVYDGKRLLKSVDYTVSYLDRDGASIGKPEKGGEYCAVIEGQGVYSGQVRVSFTINDPLPLIIAVCAAGTVILTAVIVSVAAVKKKKAG